MCEASREMTFEEEAVLYEQEFREFFAVEDSSDGGEPMINRILRRGMRIIIKARELIGENTTTESLLNPYGDYVVKFAKNHDISIDEAYQHPICKARLEYFNQTGR